MFSSNVITYSSLGVVITNNLDGYSVDGGRTPENAC